MDSRRNIPPSYVERSRMMHHGRSPPTHHPMEPLPRPELLEDKIASQAAEIEQLTVDNRKLAASYLALRQDLAAAKAEEEKIREHTRSIQSEGDIQIRILLDKIAKADADIGAGDTTKRELQAANSEARNLMTAKLELSVKLEQATKKLDYSRENIKKIPEMRAELDSLRQEYQRLRKTFEHEKCTNTEKVEQLKILENDLIGIAEEVERLRMEVLNVEKRLSSYINPDSGYPVPYTGSFGRPHPVNCNGGAVEMMNPYVSGGIPVGSGGAAAYTDSFGRPRPYDCNGGAVEMMNPYASGGIPVGSGGGAGAYTDSFGRPHSINCNGGALEMINPFASGGIPVGSGGDGGGAVEEVEDTSSAPR